MTLGKSSSHMTLQASCSASCILMDNHKINIIHLESYDTPRIMHHDSPSHLALQASCLRWMVNTHKNVRQAS